MRPQQGDQEMAQVGRAGPVVVFRFDKDAHEYVDVATGDVLPSITQMLEAEGRVDTTWLTEEGRTRGTAVHDLTCAYDLKALDVAHVEKKYKGYLLAHAAAMTLLRPTWTAVERAMVHSVYRFGGRPDRVGRVKGFHTVLEVKSGAPETYHALQTALQAILVADQGGLPAEDYQRLAVYLKRTGRFSVEKHTNLGDFTEARRIIRATCGKVAA